MTPQRFATLMVILAALFVMTVGAAIMTLKARTRTASNGIEVVDLRKTPDLNSSPDDTGLPVLFMSPSFNLIDQDAKPLTNAQLAGRPYVAAFMFTHCTTACPMMAGRLVTLQDEIRNPAVRFISFSVDPVRDTPEVLKGYLTRFKAKPDRWMFATGTKEQMEAVENGFNVRLPRRDPNATVGDPNDPMSVAPHSDRFLLVDAEGRVRGLYDSKDENSMMKLKSDANALAELR